MLESMRSLLNLFRRSVPFPETPRWVLVPLGNPGPEYAETRHNLGRRALLRWAEAEGHAPAVLRRFGTGTLYGLGPFLSLVPATYMNHSGQVVAEALAAGLDPARLVVLYDDKDLPLGTGRFRLEGSAGGHNGLASVLGAAGTERIARLRLGIGPFQRPLADWVLAPWDAEEAPRLQALEEPFAACLGLLARMDNLASLPAQVNGAPFWGPAPGKRN